MKYTDVIANPNLYHSALVEYAHNLDYLWTTLKYGDDGFYPNRAYVLTFRPTTDLLPTAYLYNIALEWFMDMVQAITIDLPHRIKLIITAESITWTHHDHIAKTFDEAWKRLVSFYGRQALDVVEVRRLNALVNSYIDGIIKEMGDKSNVIS